jgi:glc operon protein GlcG
LSITLAIAVVDDHADLVGLIRMSDARYVFLPQAATGKAMASALWGQFSGALSERATAPIMQATNQMFGGRLIFSQGAVPVKRGEKIIGAVGVGGASPQQDEEIATAAAEVIAGPD